MTSYRINQPNYIAHPAVSARIAYRPISIASRRKRLFYSYVAVSIILMTIACFNPGTALFAAALPMFFAYAVMFFLPFLAIPLAILLIPLGFLYFVVLLCTPFFFVFAGPIWTIKHMQREAKHRALFRRTYLQDGGCMRDIRSINRADEIDSWFRIAVPVTAIVLIATHALGFHLWH